MMGLACKSIIGAFLGHKFRARYDAGRPTITSIKNCAPIDAADLVEASKPMTYVHDICERCGQIIRREE